MDKNSTAVHPGATRRGALRFARQPGGSPEGAGIKRRVPDLTFELVVYCSVSSVLLSCLYYVDRMVG